MDLANLMQSLSMQERSEEEPQSNFKVFAVDIGDYHTDIALGSFSDSFVVLATQYQKVASLLRVTIDQPEDRLNISETVYSVKVVLGTDNIEQQAAARYIAEKLNLKVPLMCFLGLNNYHIDTIKLLTQILLNPPQ